MCTPLVRGYMCTPLVRGYMCTPLVRGKSSAAWFYSPLTRGAGGVGNRSNAGKIAAITDLVPERGFEPLTSSLRMKRSTLLSYSGMTPRRNSRALGNS